MKPAISINDTDLDVWSERDRTHIALRWKSGEFKDGDVIAEWWDEDAVQMFEDGFFSAKGSILGRLIDPRPLHASVFAYCETMGMLPAPPWVVCTECGTKWTRKRLPKGDDAFVCIYCVEEWQKNNPEYQTRAGWRSWLRSAKTFQEV